MMKNEATPTSVVTDAIAEEVTTALGHLAQAAETDLEAGESAPAAEADPSKTLLAGVAKSVISKVDAETSVSLIKRGGGYCFGRIRKAFTKQNMIDTFGRNGSLRRVCLEAVNCRKFSRPDGAGDWRRRIMDNFPHFKSLYLTFTVVLTAWSLLFNLWIMSGCILLVLGWYYFGPIATLLCKMESPTTVQKVTVMVPVTIVVALVTGIISKIIELGVISVLFAVTHASMHEGVGELEEGQGAEAQPAADGEAVPMAEIAPADADALGAKAASEFSGDIEAGAMAGTAATGDEDDDDDEISDFGDE